MGNIEKFNLIAGRYDTPERIETARIIADTIRTCAQDGKEKSAIDYGCGTGLVGMELLGSFKSMLFIDASAAMIEMVESKISQSGADNAAVLCCDFTAQIPKGLRADYVIMAQTLIHIKDTRLIISRMYDVLNKGGRLLIVDFDKNASVISDEVHNGFEQDKLADTILETGFTSAESKTFYHGSKMFMNEDASLFIMDAVK